MSKQRSTVSKQHSTYDIQSGDDDQQRISLTIGNAVGHSA